MKFSVLMSLYIKEKPEFLSQCFDSLANQTLHADEIVLVFDGEVTEELIKVVDEYKNLLPIKIVNIPTNIGLGKALNEGLRHCKNEWVFRMDTDDICFSNRFEKQVQFIKNSSKVVVFSSHIAEFDDNENQITGIRKVPIGNSNIREYSLKRSPFNHMTVAFKKSVVEELGGYQHHLFMEDYNLWLRFVASDNELGNVDEVLLKARAGGNMIDRRRGKEYMKSEWKLMNLKYNLGLQSFISALAIFVLRIIPKLLPAKITRLVYNIVLRK